MIKNAFRLVPKYKSGIGQIIEGKISEVKAVRATVNKKNVDDSFKILNNHDELQYETVVGSIESRMFTSKESSKGIGENKGNRTKNILISKNETICGNKKGDQHISGCKIRAEKGTMRYSVSPKAEEYTKKHATILVEKLNNSSNIPTMLIKTKMKFRDRINRNREMLAHLKSYINKTIVLGICCFHISYTTSKLKNPKQLDYYIEKECNF